MAFCKAPFVYTKIIDDVKTFYCFPYIPNINLIKTSVKSNQKAGTFLSSNLQHLRYNWLRREFMGNLFHCVDTRDKEPGGSIFLACLSYV